MKKRRPATRSRRPCRKPDAVWLTPTELERWLKDHGVTISHKSLYKTYLGKAALHRHEIERNKLGKIHARKALEVIRLVQSREPISQDAALAKRAEASARVAAAKAIMMEAEAQERVGRLVPRDMVKSVWMRAIENCKNELRALRASLSAALVGRSELEISTMLEQRHNEALRHLADGFLAEPAPRAGGAA